MQTVATGRSKRATAGNRMRELLEKAHQQDEDELFKEEEGDEEFAAPVDQRDVFLDDFADTDDEVEMDDEDEERRIRREERRKAKGKSKVYNPLGGSSKPKKVKFPAEPSAASSSTGPGTTSGRRAEDMELLDPTIDPSTMAKSTLVLALRKQRREQKRLHRDQNLRSSLRASTLRTEEEVMEKEKAEQNNPNRKGRLAQHVTGEIRVVRKMTQGEWIAAALEEEERNKESLRDWLRKEEERRELRRVGRKRVKGPRWTWVSRTVGKAVEEVEDDPARAAAARNADTPTPAPEVKTPATESISAVRVDAPKVDEGVATELETSQKDPGDAAATGSPLPPAEEVEPVAGPSISDQMPANPDQTDKPASSNLRQPPSPAQAVEPATLAVEAPSQYTRNYIILSQVPGGLARELQLVLGDHVEWDQVKYIPHRNRPINRRPTICTFTGLQAKYRHPTTLVPYANIDGYRQIEALLAHRYLWSQDLSVWMGGEEDMGADGVGQVVGWNEAINGGWVGGQKTVREDPAEDQEEITGPRKGVKRKFFDELEAERPTVKKGKSKRGKGKGRG